MKTSLTRIQWRALEDWLASKETRAVVSMQCPNQIKLAEIATQKLGFKVTKANIPKAAKTMGLTLPQGKAKVHGKGLSEVSKIVIRQVQLISKKCDVGLTIEFLALLNRMNDEEQATNNLANPQGPGSGHT